MKIKFIDINKKLVEKVKKAIPYFECINDDIFNHEGIIVSASNPSFTFGGGLDALIYAKYPNECKEKQEKKGGNERIGNVIFTITVDNNLKSNKVLIWEALQSIMMFGGEDETILLSGLGTSIGGLSEDDFVDVLKDFFPTKAYKGIDKDMKCRNMQFEVGKTYKEDGAVLCNRGFHYCNKLEDVYNYYDNNCRIFEIEIQGLVDFGLDKCCSTQIKIVKEIDNYGIKQHKSKSNSGDWNSGDRNSGHSNSGDRNSGNWNSGYRNSGDSNSGYRNSGDRNSGHWNSGNRNSGNSNSGDSNSGNRNSGNRNSGHWNSGNRNSGHWNSGNRNSGNSNSGDWNSGDRNSGYFNIDTPKIRIFGKETNKKEISFPSYFYFDLCVRVSPSEMTKEEKIEYPLYGITDGYLKTLDYKEARKLSFDKCSEGEVQQTIKLPNFDYKIFEKITGISKEMIEKRLK